MKQRLKMNWQDPHEVTSVVFAVFLVLLGVLVILGGSGKVSSGDQSFSASLFEKLGFLK